MESIFQYTDYRIYINAYLGTLRPGSKKSVSEAMRISPSLFSQILKGDRDLSADQAFRFATLLQFNSFEKTYWLTLVEANRASSPELRQFLNERLESMRLDSNVSLRKRLGLERTSWSQEFVAVFYSSWHFPVVYCLLAVAGSWTVKSVSERLLIREERILQIMEFFEKNGVIERTEAEGYRLKKTDYVFIDGRDQDTHRAAVVHNQKNFRELAIMAIEDEQFREQKQGKFMSHIALLAEQDYQEICAEIQGLIESFNAKVAAARFEKIVCLNIDCFKV